MISFTNASGGALNLARRVGVGDGTIAAFANGTVDSFTINGSNTFRLHLQGPAHQVVVEGVVRQDRPDPNNGQCLVWGTVETFR